MHSGSAEDQQRATVSIIVPVYNVEPYLAQCVDSLLAQTYAELDVILVDDGSPDGCPQICDRYAETDARVRVVHQANRGLSGARNAGLAQVRGDLVMFVDADDWLAPDAVEHLVGALDWCQADVAIGNYVATTGAEPERPAAEVTLSRLTRDQALNRMSGETYTQMVVAWFKLYRRSVLDGMEFPEGRIHEDEFMAHRLLANVDVVAVSSSPCYYYRIRPGAITSSTSFLGVIDALDALEDRGEFLLREGLVPLAQQTYWLAFVGVMRARGQLHLTAEEDAKLTGRVRGLQRGMRTAGVGRLRTTIVDGYLARPAAVARAHAALTSARPTARALLSRGGR